MKQGLFFLIVTLTHSFLPTPIAQELDFPDTPLYLQLQAHPNVFFMADDSLTMDFEIAAPLNHHYYELYWSEHARSPVLGSGFYYNFTPEYFGTPCPGVAVFSYLYSSFRNLDNLGNQCRGLAQIEDNKESLLSDWRPLSSDFNLLFYDPAEKYNPWPGYPDAQFSAARSYPEPGSTGYSLIRDLDGFEYIVAHDDHGFDGEIPRGTTNINDVPNGLVDLYDSRTQYKVDADTILIRELNTPDSEMIKRIGKECTLSDSINNPPFQNCFGTSESTSSLSGGQIDNWGRTVEDIKQNIANWYQYHRRRSLSLKAAISEAVTQNDNIRFGFSVINHTFTDRLFIPVPETSAHGYATHNDELISALSKHEFRDGFTPLRRGLELVGRYYSGDLDEYSNPIELACQKNYAVLLTDGFWNGYAPLSPEIGDEDGDGLPEVTVADVAHYYFNNDLSDLPDEVPTSEEVDNSKQHMTTFTVSFGLDGRLVDSNGDGWPNPMLRENDEWFVGDNFRREDKIDDLWHAAYNSAGVFIVASTPQELSDSIKQLLSVVSNRSASSSSIALNSGSLSTNSLLYQAGFDSTYWHGTLSAIPLKLDGETESPIWEAGELLDSQDYMHSREILSWNGTVGVAFRFPENIGEGTTEHEMSLDQVDLLLQDAGLGTMQISAQEYGEKLVNFLRGDRSYEGEDLFFRERQSLLGDIVNSTPLYIGDPRATYPSDIEDVPYSKFAESTRGRREIVYIGSNDGMLHGFDAKTGEEVFAYVPGSVYPNLETLATQSYSHKYLVDGSPNAADVYFNDGRGSGSWHTVLVGGLRSGGQSFFALDVTDPDSISEENAINTVLWEFEHPDLGYSFSKPQIAKMADGSWAAVFSSGYNNSEQDNLVSKTGHGAVFIVDIQTGNLIRVLDTNTGTLDAPNGVATPLLIDVNKDSIVDYIYAGDLQGNLWKFDVTAEQPSRWRSALGSQGSPEPLFSGGQNLPITSQPEATSHPDNLGGVMIYFGTGKYLERFDSMASDQTNQYFFGIWDKNTTEQSAVSMRDLLGQSISNQYSITSEPSSSDPFPIEYSVREISDNKIDWGQHSGWFLPLLPERVDGRHNSENFGERQISKPVIRNGRVIFTTVLPQEDPCSPGGKSYLMQLNFRNGGRLDFPAFDLNGDGEFNSADTNASGFLSNVGIMPSVSLVRDGASDIALGSGSSGDLQTVRLSVGPESYGRQSWRRLK